MPDLKLHFMHPTDGRKITVDVDESVRRDQSIVRRVTTRIEVSLSGDVPRVGERRSVARVEISGE